MRTTLVVITVVLLQQGLVAALWAAMAWLRLSRGPALHWALAAAAVCAGLVLVGQRDSLPEWAGFWLASGLVLAGLMAVRRGVALFARRPLADAEQAAIWGLTMAALGAALAAGPRWLFVSIISAALCHVFAATAWTVRRHLAGEFGVRAATGCAVPFALIAAVFALRTVFAPVLPQSIGSSVHTEGAANVASTLVFLVAGLLLQFGLLALVMARLLLRLRHQSEHDELTGLLNRRAIGQRLREEAERLTRYGQAYSVLSIDLDHFKTINDRFGHPAGDAVLRDVGRLLRQVGRSVDHVARVGGEEFWMLIPSTGAEGALQVAERLRRAVDELRPSALRGELPLAVSIGVAVADRAGEPVEALMQRLDAALYRAKAGGRNRVELAAGPGPA
ncbi:MAG: GGDEF domain-containing protein [Rubrivivax sp.]|nr:GGDEF domain-containing protein [Rubrivivax sp.]